jgi:hypothetical protein
MNLIFNLSSHSLLIVLIWTLSLHADDFTKNKTSILEKVIYANENDYLISQIKEVEVTKIFTYIDSKDIEGIKIIELGEISEIIIPLQGLSGLPLWEIRNSCGISRCGKSAGPFYCNGRKLNQSGGRGRWK